MGASVTYYDILKVSRRTAPDGVRTAYRRLAQKYHPDKLPGNADAVRVMAMLNEAYGVLSDPDRRASYDRRIEDERACRRRAITPIEVPTAAWPWYLLFVTIAFALAAVATVVYKEVVPGVAVAVSATATQGGTPAVPAQPPVKPKSD
jgi:curved DNA-binding protein CbpA